MRIGKRINAPVMPDPRGDRARNVITDPAFDEVASQISDQRLCSGIGEEEMGEVIHRAVSLLPVWRGLSSPRPAGWKACVTPSAAPTGTAVGRRYYPPASSARAPYSACCR